jgi:hypothetical protein
MIMTKEIRGKLAILAVLVASLAQASIARAVEFPQQIQIDDKTLTLTGTGTRDGGTYRIKVYKAALYLEHPSKNFLGILRSKEAKRLILRFDIQVNRATILAAWEEGFKRHGEKNLPALRPRLDKLLGWMGDVQAGDTFEFTYTADKGIEVVLKGVSKGILEGDDFARVFFSIWLGTSPVDFQLKEGLLGRG